MKTFDFNKETGQFSIGEAIFSPEDTADRVRELLGSLKSYEELVFEDFSVEIGLWERIGLKDLIFGPAFNFDRSGKLACFKMMLCNGESARDMAYDYQYAVNDQKTLTRFFRKHYSLSNMKGSRANFGWGCLRIIADPGKWSDPTCIVLIEAKDSDAPRIHPMENKKEAAKEFGFKKENGQFSIGEAIFSPGDTVSKVKELLQSSGISYKEFVYGNHSSRLNLQEEIGLKNLRFEPDFCFDEDGKLTRFRMALSSPKKQRRSDQRKVAKLLTEQFALTNMKRDGLREDNHEMAELMDDVADFCWGRLAVERNNFIAVINLWYGLSWEGGGFTRFRHPDWIDLR